MERAIRLRAIPDTDGYVFMSVSEEEVMEIEIEDETIYKICGMLVEYLDGEFFGLVEKATEFNRHGEPINSELIATGLVFSPYEIDQVLQHMTGETLI